MRRRGAGVNRFLSNFGFSSDAFPEDQGLPSSADKGMMRNDDGSDTNLGDYPSWHSAHTIVKRLYIPEDTSVEIPAEEVK